MTALIMFVIVALVILAVCGVLIICIRKSGATPPISNYLEIAIILVGLLLFLGYALPKLGINLG